MNPQRSRMGWKLIVVCAGGLLVRAQHAGATTVAEIAKNPAAFDHKTITVTGIAGEVSSRASRRGNPYTTFRLSEEGESLKVFTFGTPAVKDGQQVEVRGIFQQVKQVGRYTFHNEIQASSVRATASGTRQRQSRSTRSPSTTKAATSTPSMPAATEAITRFRDVCTAALPPGWYIERLRLAVGTRPVTCADRLDALESEIDDLESEKADLEEECENEE